MLRWAVIFLIIALVAAVFGFTDVSAASASIAKILFAIFLIGFLLVVVFGFLLGSRLSRP
jgi:uncharacterized membrane protein YtjA (UPF0391 family)